MKVAFLDRDGTIVRDYPDVKWRDVVEPEFLPRAIKALSELQAREFELIILTNQYTIGEGIISQRQYDEFTASMLAQLSSSGINILDVFHCPDSRGQAENCLKPSPAMFDAALLRYPDVDLESSIMLGDSQCDADVAFEAGLRFFGIGEAGETAYGTRVKSLAEVVEYL